MDSNKSILYKEHNYVLHWKTEFLIVVTDSCINHRRKENIDELNLKSITIRPPLPASLLVSFSSELKD